MQALGEYTAELLQHVEHDIAAVQAAQHRTTAAELGIAPLDAMADLDSIPARIQFINRLASEVSAASEPTACGLPVSPLCPDSRCDALQQAPKPPARVAIVTTVQQNLTGLRREVLSWIAYHLDIGVSHFYVRPCHAPAYEQPKTWGCSSLWNEGRV